MQSTRGNRFWQFYETPEGDMVLTDVEENTNNNDPTHKDEHTTLRYRPKELFILLCLF